MVIEFFVSNKIYPNQFQRKAEPNRKQKQKKQKYALSKYLTKPCPAKAVKLSRFVGIA